MRGSLLASRIPVLVLGMRYLDNNFLHVIPRAARGTIYVRIWSLACIILIKLWRDHVAYGCTGK